MKPKIYLRGHFYDAGWKYERWVCAGAMRVGSGSSPKAAYEDWAHWVSVSRADA